MFKNLYQLTSNDLNAKFSTHTPRACNINDLNVNSGASTGCHLMSQCRKMLYIISNNELSYKLVKTFYTGFHAVSIRHWNFF